jgi:hypothetical protein
MDKYVLGVTKMDIRILTKLEILSCVLVVLGVLCQVILQIFFYILYFYISTIFIGTGFIIFSLSILSSNNRVKRMQSQINEEKVYSERKFFYLSLFSLILGAIYPIGEFLHQYGKITSEIEMVIGGTLLNAFRIIISGVLCAISFYITFQYKKHNSNKIINNLPEILLLITLLATLFPNTNSILSYNCYLSFHLPSCFSVEYYMIKDASILFMAVFLVKLIYISYLSRNLLVQKNVNLQKIQ